MAEESRLGPLGALGKAIRVRRTDLDLKRRDLAERTGLSYPYVSEIENGAKLPSDQALARIAEALEMPVSELTALREAYAENLTVWTSEAAWRPASAVMDDPGSLPLSTAASPRARSLQPQVSASASRVRRPDAQQTIADLVGHLVRIELERWAIEELPGIIEREVQRVVTDRETRQ